MRYFLLSILSATLIAVFGCSEDSSSVKPNASEARTDIEPIKKRFVSISPSIEAAQWFGGSKGNSSRGAVPGPSEVYLTGYISISDTQWDSLTKILDESEDTTMIDTSTILFDNTLTDMNDNASFETSREFYESLKPQKYYGTIYVSRNHPIIYFDLNSNP